MIAQTAGVNAIYAEAQSVVPPPRLSASHERVLEAFRLDSQAADELRYGIENNDAASIEASNSHLKQAISTLEEGRQLLPLTPTEAAIPTIESDADCDPRNLTNCES